MTVNMLNSVVVVISEDDSVEVFSTSNASVFIVDNRMPDNIDTWRVEANDPLEAIYDIIGNDPDSIPVENNEEIIASQTLNTNNVIPIR